MDVTLTPVDDLYFSSFVPAMVMGVVSLVLWFAFLLGRSRASTVAKAIRSIAIASTIIDAALVAFIGLMYSYYTYDGYVRSKAASIWIGQHTHVLAEPSQIPGGWLPAGTSVMEDDRGQLTSAYLFTQTRLSGITMVGGVTLSSGFPEGDVTIVRDQIIDGVPCRAGELVILNAGRLGGCTLASSYSAFGRRWPAGSRVDIADYSVSITPKGAKETLYFRRAPR